MVLSRIAAALLVASLGGCADDASSSPPTTPQYVSVLRLGDDGVHVGLSRDQTTTVFLPSSSEWSEPVVDSDAVTISEDVSDEGSGTRSWTVTGRVTGTAQVSLTGQGVEWTATFTVH